MIRNRGGALILCLSLLLMNFSTCVVQAEGLPYAESTEEAVEETVGEETPSRVDDVETTEEAVSTEVLTEAEEVEDVVDETVGDEASTEKVEDVVIDSEEGNYSDEIASDSVDYSISICSGAYFSSFYLGDNGTNNGRGTWFKDGSWDEGYFSLPSEYRPTRTGYTFTGWWDGYYTSNLGNLYWDTNLNSVHYYGPGNFGEFIAGWTPNNYTIAFDGNGATSGGIGSSVIHIGDRFALPNNYARTGYTFRGYAVVRRSDNALLCGSSGWQNGTYYWQHPETWSLYGQDSTQTLNTSWLNANAADDTFVFYAQWSANNYTMTSNHYLYDPVSASWVLWKTTSANATYGSVYTPAYVTPPTGYQAYSRDWNGGWSVSGNGTFSVYYYPSSYTLTINPNGGSYNNTTSASKATLTYNSQACNYLGSPSRAGYTFTGWYSAANGGEAIWDVNGHAIQYQKHTYYWKNGSQWSASWMGGSYSDWTNMRWNYVNNLTTYAHWSPNTYKLTVYVDGGSGTNGDFNMTYGSSKDLGTPTRKGCTFTGWKTSTNNSVGSTLSGNTFKMGYNKSYPNSGYTAASTVVIKAQWKANNYKVTFDANGGTSSYSNLDVTFGSSSNNKITIPTRAHYIFDGWYTDKQNGVKVYNADGSCSNEGTYWSNSKWNYDNNAKLYAHWVLSECVTSLDAGDGSCDVTNQVDKISTVYTKLPTATRTGYDFVGWFTERDGRGTEVKVGSTVPSVEYTTLYAYYTFHPVTVSVPKVLVSNADGNCSFKVSADNTIGKVLVSVDNAFSMHQQNKNQVVSGKVTLSSNELTPTNHTIKGNVDLTGLSCGTWSGEFSIRLNYSAD